MKIRTIKRVVSEYYDIDLDNRCRKVRYSLPRKITVYLCKALTDKSYSQIGQYISNEHHTSLMYGNNKIKKAIKGKFWDDKRIQKDVKKIKRILEKL